MDGQARRRRIPSSDDSEGEAEFLRGVGRSLGERGAESQRARAAEQETSSCADPVGGRSEVAESVGADERATDAAVVEAEAADCRRAETSVDEAPESTWQQETAGADVRASIDISLREVVEGGWLGGDDGVEAIAESNVETTTADGDIAQPECGAAPSMVGEMIGERVLLDGSSTQGGMVAEVSNSTVFIALDDGTWTHLPLASASERLCIPLEDPPPSLVVGLACDKPGVLAGMLLGSANHRTNPEMVMGAPAYYAYISKPTERPHRGLRARSGDGRKQSFAMGDVVLQLPKNVPDGATPSQAAVARVVYKERCGREQGRKMLILWELLAVDERAPADAHPPEFFPASWSNWTRVVSPTREEGEYDLQEAQTYNEQLSVENIRKMDAVSA